MATSRPSRTPPTQGTTQVAAQGAVLAVPQAQGSPQIAFSTPPNQVKPTSQTNATAQSGALGSPSNEKPGQAASSTKQPRPPLLKRLADITLLTKEWYFKRERAKKRKTEYRAFIAPEQTAKYPLGYPSIANWISADIDGRVYRRFSYVRNGILLRYQYRIAKLEDELIKLDEEDELKAATGDNYAQARLISWKYNDFPPATVPIRSTRRKEIFDDLEIMLEKYDNLLQREHEIMSIQPCPHKSHKGLFDFIYNGKSLSNDAADPIKHLPPSEYSYLSHRNDFLLLGNQEDTWLHTYTRYIKPFIPKWLAHHLLMSPADRALSAAVDANAKVTFYSNERTGRLIKAVVCMATTALLVVPVVVLYAMSVHEASGWSKIGVLLAFTVLFSFVLAALTNASRSEMFGASAGYCAVLIVFLTYSGP